MAPTKMARVETRAATRWQQGRRRDPLRIPQNQRTPRGGEWVQCDEARCGKWRRIPAAVKITDAQRWVCSMNAWDRERASCAAAEEDYGEEA